MVKIFSIAFPHRLELSLIKADNASVLLKGKFKHFANCNCKYRASPLKILQEWHRILERVTF